MKTFASIVLEPKKLANELREFRQFLSGNGRPKERAHIAPFFKSKSQLCAAIGYTNGLIAHPTHYASELDLFGDFACDAASGDQPRNAYSLVEFEDAEECSIFDALKAGKAIRQWSRRFEHGSSQLVDWAWRLSTEGHGSSALARIFPTQSPQIHFLLVCGRNTDLDDADFARLRWRTNHVSFGTYRMTCLTYDDLLEFLEARMAFILSAPQT